MRRALVHGLTLAALCLALFVGTAAGEAAGDLCAPPKFKLEKWRPISDISGVTLKLPPEYPLTSGSRNSTTYRFFDGGRTAIYVGVGQGPTVNYEGSNLRSACETVINGHGVSIALTATPHPLRTDYRIIAHFHGTSTQQQVFVAFDSDFLSDINSYRQLFWTVMFKDSPQSPVAAAPAVTPASTPATFASSQAAPTPAPACNPDPKVPAADAIVDTALVQMLMSGAGPMPKGFVSFALKFSGESLAGISVAQSDLPDATQRQLATLVASNVRPHDAKSSAQYLLRIETQEQGTHYTVQPACAP